MGSMITGVSLVVASWVLLACPTSAQEPEDEYRRWTTGQNLPEWGRELLASRAADLTISFSANPFFLRADSDGDDRWDLAVRVRRSPEGPVGLIILHRDGRVFRMGEGAGVDGEPLDLEAFWIWGADEDKDAGRELFRLSKPESSSAIIHWNGERYVRMWNGD